MKRILTLLFALAVALPAWAVETKGSGGSGPNAASRTRTVSWQNGDTGDSAAIPNQCAVWRASFNGTSAAASVYAITDSTAAANTGTLLASFSSTSAAVTTFETTYPWIKVDVTDDPASGTAYLYLYCAEEAGTGGGASIPGLTGTAGNDLTFDALVKTINFESLPGFPRFYFSAEDTNTGCTPSTAGTCLTAGDDTNPCTWQAPCLTVEKAFDLMQRTDVIVVFDALDSWNTATEWGSFTGADITRVCGPTTGELFQDVPCGFMISSEMSNPATFDCTNISIADGARIFGVAQGSGAGFGYYGFSGIRTENCPRQPVATNSSVSVFGTLGGNIVTVGVHCDNVPGYEAHCFSQDNRGSIVVINSGYRHRATSDFDNGATYCGTLASGCCTDTDTPYFGCTATPSSQYDANAHGFEVGGSDQGRNGYLTIGGDYLLEIDQLKGGTGNQQIAPFVFEPDSTTGYNAYILGVASRGPAAISRASGTTNTAFCYGIMPQSSGTDAEMNYTIARSTCAGWPAWSWTGTIKPSAAYLNNLSGGTSTINFTMFQSTIKDTYEGLRTNAQFVNDTLNVDMQCNIIDQLRATGVDEYVLSMGSGNAGRVVIDADGTNVYDADTTTGTDIFALGDPPSDEETASAVPQCEGTGCSGDSCSSSTVQDCVDVNADFFGLDSSPPEVDGTATAGNPFGALDDQAACQEDQECFELCDGITKRIEFTPVFVPQAVKGTAIKSLTLGTHFKHAGAR